MVRINETRADLSVRVFPYNGNQLTVVCSSETLGCVTKRNSPRVADVRLFQSLGDFGYPRIKNG